MTWTAIRTPRSIPSVSLIRGRIPRTGGRPQREPRDAAPAVDLAVPPRRRGGPGCLPDQDRGMIPARSFRRLARSAIPSSGMLAIWRIVSGPRANPRFSRTRTPKRRVRIRAGDTRGRCRPASADPGRPPRWYATRTAGHLGSPGADGSGATSRGTVRTSSVSPPDHRSSMDGADSPSEGHPGPFAIADPESHRRSPPDYGRSPARGSTSDSSTQSRPGPRRLLYEPRSRSSDAPNAIAILGGELRRCRSSARPSRPETIPENIEKASGASSSGGIRQASPARPSCGALDRDAVILNRQGSPRSASTRSPRTGRGSSLGGRADRASWESRPVPASGKSCRPRQGSGGRNHSNPSPRSVQQARVDLPEIRPGPPSRPGWLARSHRPSLTRSWPQSRLLSIRCSGPPVRALPRPN